MFAFTVQVPTLTAEIEPVLGFTEHTLGVGVEYVIVPVPADAVAATSGMTPVNK